MDYLIFDPMLDNLREDPEFKDMFADKSREREEIKNLFHERLAEYKANNELKWLTAN